MPIIEADIIHRYSGSGEVGNPDLSLGGAINAANPAGVIVSDTDNNDMDDITSTEAAAGIVIYRGYYYSNEVTSATLTWIDPVFWIESITSSGDTDVAIAIADEAKNVAIETIVDEETAPVGPSFNAPLNKAGGLTIGDLDQNDFRGHWVRYNVIRGAVSDTDAYTIRAEGDTLP